MKVITETRGTRWRLSQKHVVLDEGYHRNTSYQMKVITETRRTRWGLLQKHLKHFCIAWAEAEGCTVVLKGGTISMPTGRYVDNDFENKNWFLMDFLVLFISSPDPKGGSGELLPSLGVRRRHVRWCRAPTNMATVTKNRTYGKIAGFE